MWRNYLTVGIRALTKNKTYAFINIFGLAIGLAACLLIFLYVRFELSYDKWLPNSENTYQLQSWLRSSEASEEKMLQMTSYVAGISLKKDFPEVDKTVYALASEPVLLHNGEALSSNNVLLVDNLFFDVLQFPLIDGDPKRALAEVGSIVLTENEAQRLFGNERAMGRTVTMVTRGVTADYRVTGIAKELPKNSHIDFSMVARFDPTTFFSDSPGFFTTWGWQSGWFYFTLKPGTDPKAISEQLPAWEKRNIKIQRIGDQIYDAGKEQDWKITKVGDVHLGEAQYAAMRRGNDQRTIMTFAIIAILILVMASVNFTNLATARASQRAREVALRKVLGATRRQLIIQFIGESILVATLAMVLALAFVEVTLPYLSAFVDSDLKLSYFGADGLLPPIIGLVIAVGAAGGVYPAFYLSRFQPAHVLKANKSTAEAAGSGHLRNGLVVGQFAISIGLMICTAVVYAQTVYARTADPGYRRQGIIQIEGISRRQIAPMVETIVEEMKRVESVTAVGRSAIGIATHNTMNTSVKIPGRSALVALGYYGIDTGFFDTMGIKLLAGRNFDLNRPADDSSLPISASPEDQKALVERGMNVIVNELALERLGFADAQSAIGKVIKVEHADAQYGLVPATIVGVVQNSRFRSVRDPLEAIMFHYDKAAANTLLIRYDTTDPNAVRERTEAVWKRLAPDVPYDGKFSEDIIEELYEGEEARAKTFAGFAFLAVIVACLGLFGLASFTAERRTKEIGIRKVLGARSRDIVRLLTWQFSKPVIIANIIAWPAAWWVMRDWLNTFDTRIDLGPGPFILAGSLALIIAIGTIGGHAFRVARSNPVYALRYE